ncbi:hypothetical protein MKEN_01144700 [Mycena kentingensis (nom. inval.)]|nr:hypothetical protein MKEN_01144700 [Mycena kentingensis (nom. inval.)]
MLAVAYIVLAASLTIASPVPVETVPSNSAPGCFVKTVDGDRKLVHKYNVNDLRQDKNVVHNAESEAVFARCCNNEPPTQGDGQRVGPSHLAEDKAHVDENTGHPEHAPFEDVDVDDTNGNRKASISDDTPVDPKKKLSTPKPSTSDAQRVQNKADPTSNQLDPKLNAFENLAKEYAADDARVNKKKVDENAGVQDPVGANNRKSSPSVAAEESVPAPAQKSDPNAFKSSQLASKLNNLENGPEQKVGSNAEPCEDSNAEADVEPSNQRAGNEHEQLSAKEASGAPSTDFVKQLEGDVRKPTENGSKQKVGTTAKPSEDNVEADVEPSNQRAGDEHEQLSTKEGSGAPSTDLVKQLEGDVKKPTENGSKQKVGTTAKPSEDNVEADVEPSGQRAGNEHEQLSAKEGGGAPSIVKELEGAAKELESSANPGQPKEKVEAKLGEQKCTCL